MGVSKIGVTKCDTFQIAPNTAMPGEEEPTPQRPSSPCPVAEPDTVFSNKASFNYALRIDQEDQALAPDNPLQQLLFDRLPIPQSEKPAFFKWLVSEEYERQKQERAAECDGGAQRVLQPNERREGSADVL